jgi:hypothetical protein
MKSTDLITILGNVSQSLFPVQHLITGGAYLLGIILILSALVKLHKVYGHGSSHEKTITPMAFFVLGAALLYLPTTMTFMANTAFGVGNVLTYGNYNPKSIYSSMGLVIRTAGLIWFIRGSVLVAQASEPGGQHGMKGLVFIIAGILAMNFDNTIAMINTLLSKFMAWFSKL